MSLGTWALIAAGAFVAFVYLVAVSYALWIDRTPKPLSPHEQVRRIFADAHAAMVEAAGKANPFGLRKW